MEREVCSALGSRISGGPSHSESYCRATSTGYLHAASGRYLEQLALTLEESLEEIGALLGHEAPNHLRTVIHPRMPE